MNTSTAPSFNYTVRVNRDSIYLSSLQSDMKYYFENIQTKLTSIDFANISDEDREAILTDVINNASRIINSAAAKLKKPVSGYDKAINMLETLKQN